MPNWCENTMVVSGSPEAIARFKAQAGFEGGDATGDHGFIGTLLPLGTDTPDTVDAQRARWGIKWGDCEAYIGTETAKALLIRFNTPWGPAVEAHDAIAAMFSDLRFHLDWDEPGMEVAGTFVWQAGVRVSTEERSNSRSSDEFNAVS